MIIPVILAGGSGTRLWPLSRDLSPKQLLKLNGDRTMLQQTVQRVIDFIGMQLPLVICNEKQKHLVAQQLRDIRVRNTGIFLEPMGRNTAPAVAVAALKALSMSLESLILILPADHLIQDEEKFHQALAVAADFARDGNLVTFGIVPDRPETGYGYIKKGRGVPVAQESGEDEDIPVFAIDKFVEKPDLETARAYVSSGEYCWNSGMFMFRAASVLDEMKRHVPDIVSACQDAFHQGKMDQDFFRLDKDAFRKCPSDSIDYAVMEKTDRGIMIPLDAGWDDLGSWEAIWNVSEKDLSGNVFYGDVIGFDVNDSYIHAQDRLVTAYGVNDLVVVESADALLVASLSKTQGVKKIVDTLKASNRREAVSHKNQPQPWGAMETIDSANAYYVRRITVRAGITFSFPSHPYATLRWIPLDGVATLTIGEESRRFEANDAVTIQPKVHVQLENKGPAPFIFLEILPGNPKEPDHFMVG
ncbi:MAG: mannose-1-phosphate guanylyltransferase/mannose-6-phosphate isomerase [Desulfobacterales bacterium]|nr:mannose-1-phosphate guanylyltransferase/mannose-6-phosphate isomerase [Desulfobacterales bacterium]